MYLLSDELNCKNHWCHDPYYACHGLTGVGERNHCLDSKWKCSPPKHRVSQQNGCSVPAVYLHVDGKNACQLGVLTVLLFFFKLQNNWEVKRNKVSDLQPLSSWCCITHRNRKIMDSSWVNYLDRVFPNKDIILNIHMYQWRLGLFKIRLSRPK